MVFTVFTPTYNRKALLLNLYESLIAQTFTDFEWLIVDDGSTDGTREVISNLVNQQKINIRYYYKENGGKHTAINVGAKMAEGELFTIVDSDDTLLNHALEILYENYLDIKSDKNICGITGLSSNYNHEIIGTKFIFQEKDVNFADIYLKFGVRGDKSVSFKTAILKQYPFPEKIGVNFVFEAVVWHEISKNYKIRCVNEVIQYVDYQNEGNSDSSYKLWYIKGLAFSYFTMVTKNIHPFGKYPKSFIWNYVHLVSNALLCKENYFGQLNKLNQKLIYILVFPRAFWSYLKMKKLIIT